MKLSRRDLLLWGAGAAAGLVVTPVPWKLLDDVSIWTQNWPWIPQPARGPVDIQQSICTLCSQGCGLRVRMAGGWPVGVAGDPQHPISRGALCPLAFGAHQLLWHPQRLREVRHRGSTSSWNDARRAFKRACSEGPVLIIDGRPGRATSAIFQVFAQTHGGSYQAVPNSDALALAPYATWTGVPAGELGFDLENAQTIISFGAPMLDGWGTPGRFTRLWADRAAGLADPQLRLIQIEAELSRTAVRAWQWFRIQPGTEAALAAGLASVMVEERLVHTHGPAPTLPLAEAVAQTGLDNSAIRDLARTMVARTPAVVIANDDNPAIAALNVLLSAVGGRGGIVRRSQSAREGISGKAASGPVRAVLMDATVPWNFSPQVNAEVFRFAAWDGGSSQADWLLPAPGFLEEATDVATPPASAVETYAVVIGLVKAPSEARSAVDLLTSIDPALPTTDRLIHARCESIFRARRGILSGQPSTPVAQFASAAKLEEQIRKGAIWIGEQAEVGGLRCELKSWPAPSTPTAREVAGAWAAPVLPPLATKLYQESDLREAAERRIA